MYRNLLRMCLCALGASLVWAAPAGAQGWPALEVADFKAVGGGAQDAAVLIGIDNYAFMPHVVGAEANARAWEQWLRKGRQVPGSNIRRLVGSDVDRSQVQRAVEDAVRRVGKDGTLYFVFVGHGAPAKGRGGQEPFLLLGDTKKSIESFAQRGVGVESELSAWLQPAAAKGAKVVAVLDACFTGKAQGGGDLIEGAQFAALSSMAAPAALTLLSATSSKDITGPLPGGARPAFSYLVLAALRGWGDQNGDNIVTVQEAVDFAATVMLDAQRPEVPSFSGKNVSLAKSGGEATPAYRSWLGRVAAEVVSTVRPQVAPVVSAPMLGADADIGALAAQAERFEAEREAAVAATRRAEQAAAALAAAKAAEAERLVAEAQSTLRSQVERDFGAIRRLVEQPSDAGRPVLEAFVKKYGAASVSIDGVSHRLEVPEVALVERALASRGSVGGSDGGANPAGIDWVRIEGDSFQMGSSNGSDDEKPMRRVTVPTFHLAKTEVTVAQYRACVDAGRCSAPDTCDWGSPNWGQSGRESHPVNCVSLEQASAFSAWANARLPSEAEWEFAARSRGRDQTYPWGDREADSGLAVMKGSGGTAPVCSKSSGNSAQGVCDLAGNVLEWVVDWYGPYGEAATDGSARSRPAEYRVVRGGGWYNPADALRAAYRGISPPGNRSSNLGFRIAR